MNRTLIMQHTTALIQGFLKQIDSIWQLDHAPTKGQLREMFVSNVLQGYLSSQFGTGSGIIVNQYGEQSRQTDIIIYDKRIVPPFIWQQNLGVFPVESVVETIEVKSSFGLPDVVKANEAAGLIKEIARKAIPVQGSNAVQPGPPGNTIIGFEDKGLGQLKDAETGLTWLLQNTQNIWGVCLAGGFSWLRVGKEKERPWVLVEADEFSEETKRFVAVVLDNARTKAERNYYGAYHHRDLLGIYTRDNPSIKQHIADQVALTTTSTTSEDEQ